MPSYKTRQDPVKSYRDLSSTKPTHYGLQKFFDSLEKFILALSR